MIKWNTLVIIIIKTQTRYYLLKHFSISIITNNFHSCSKWTNSQQCRWPCWSLSDWCCCCRRVFLFVEQNGVVCWTSNLQVVKRCWWKGSINARSKNSVYIELIIFLVEFNIVQISSRHLISACVQALLCTYAWKYFVPHFMCCLLVGGHWSSR